MSVIQVGLVDTTGKIDPELVQSAAAALNIQVIRDLPQYWNVKATVTYLPGASKVPAGVWPVQLVASLPPGSDPMQAIAMEAAKNFQTQQAMENIDRLFKTISQILAAGHEIAMNAIRNMKG